MKLFKKVMASVLAGVLALSMAACGTAPVEPETPVVNPTTTGAAQILDFMNQDVAEVGANLVKTDDGMNKIAAAILDYADEYGLWTKKKDAGYDILKLNDEKAEVSLEQYLQNKNLYGDADKIKVVNAFTRTTGTDGTVTRTITALNALKYLEKDDCVFEGKYYQVTQLNSTGRYATQFNKVGVATKTIEGMNVVIILVK